MTNHLSLHYDELWRSAGKERRRAGVISNVLITLCAIAFGCLFVTSGLALQGADVGWFLVAAAVASAVLSRLVFHAQRRLLLARKRTAWYRKALDRIDPEWQGEDDDSDRFAELMPIGEDQIGLFGAGSLFDRICTCDTEPGRERLASWLAQPSPAVDVRERQDAVQELAAAPEFRREFGVACMNFTDLGRLNTLRDWLAEPDSPLRTNYLLLLLVIAPLVTLAVSISYWFGLLPGGLGLALTAVAGAFHYWLGAITGSSLGTLASQASQLIEFDLQAVSNVAQVVAAHSWTADILIAAKTGILSTLVESGAVQALRRGSALLAFANNENQWLLSVFFLIPQIAALRLHAWKKAHGSQVRQAIETIANVEALVALGNYAAENSAHSYPKVSDARGGEQNLQAKALGHPLIDAAVCVPNDVALGDESRYWVISGSNMGGKSTLLRAIGLNLSLAWAGAPVRAESLETSTGAIAASISVSDALGEGQSKFSAEVTLLKKILDYVESSPGCVVLLDELLSGTNTGDRRVAALEIVRRLARAKSLGIVTTHDLAVSADLLTLPNFHSKHFAANETAEGLHFDYKVRDGVVRCTNGLAVLRMLGIEIETGPAT